MDRSPLRFGLRLKLQQLPTLLPHLALLPTKLALSLRQLESFPVVEGLLRAAILRLLLAPHGALFGPNIGDHGCA